MDNGMNDRDRSHISAWVDGRRLGSAARVVFLFVFACSPMMSVVYSQVPPPPSSSKAKAAKPKLYVDRRMLNLGEIIEGDKPEVTWILENRGNADLLIDLVKAGCGCTVVQLEDDDRLIPPGSMLELSAVFDSKGRRGEQRKNVIVYSNDPAESALKLEFSSAVLPLYDADPSGAINLRMMQRGEWAQRSLKLKPSDGRESLEIIDVTLADADSVEAIVEPMADENGHVVKFKVLPSAALGRVDTTAEIQLRVDGIERSREVKLRGEVVADLVFQPKLVNATRAPAVRGTELQPITVRAVESAPFQVRGVDGGPCLQVTYEELAGKPGTVYRFQPVIRQDAPDGPFAAEIVIQTTSLDQPELRVPVFGHVAPKILVDPPVIVLRKDGTPAGRQRRVKFQSAPQEALELLDAQMSTDVVSARLDYEASSSYRHLRFVNVTLDGDPGPGIHEATLTLRTSLAGAETVVVPIRIEIP
ncbi:MAG: DUF1573 domain-containing protein [Phycisphaerae bacterium]